MLPCWLLCCDSKSYRFTPNTSWDMMSLPFLLVKSRVCQIEPEKTANVDAPFNILFYFIRKLHFMYLWIYRMCCCCCRCVDGVAVAFTHCVARAFFLSIRISKLETNSINARAASQPENQRGKQHMACRFMLLALSLLQTIYYSCNNIRSVVVGGFPLHVWIRFFDLYFQWRNVVLAIHYYYWRAPDAWHVQMIKTADSNQRRSCEVPFGLPLPIHHDAKKCKYLYAICISPSNRREPMANKRDWQQNV